MASNLSIQAPDFDRIRSEAGVAAHDAARLLWTALNFEMSNRRRTVRESKETLAPKVVEDAPTANQNNYDLAGASILHLTGSSSVNITGFRAPGTDQSHILFIHVSGTGTITVPNQSASSDAENRVVNVAAANVTIATNETMILMYLSSRWREIELAV